MHELVGKGCNRRRSEVLGFCLFQKGIISQSIRKGVGTFNLEEVVGSDPRYISYSQQDEILCTFKNDLKRNSQATNANIDELYKKKRQLY